MAIMSNFIIDVYSFDKDHNGLLSYEEFRSINDVYGSDDDVCARIWFISYNN